MAKTNEVKSILETLELAVREHKRLRGAFGLPIPIFFEQMGYLSNGEFYFNDEFWALFQDEAKAMIVKAANNNVRAGRRGHYIAKVEMGECSKFRGIPINRLENGWEARPLVGVNNPGGYDERP